MHSNGGRCLAPEAKSPVVGESRRVRYPAALVHRRSFGGTGAIAGATGEKLRTALVMRHFASLFVCDGRVLSLAPRPVGAQRNHGRGNRTSSTFEYVCPEDMTKGPNENRVSIAFPHERNSGMESG